MAVVIGRALGKYGQPFKSLVSWQIQRMRSAASCGWSPNSSAIRLVQPAAPRRRTVLPIASATVPAIRASEGCSGEANSASRTASFTVILVTATLLGQHTGDGFHRARRRAVAIT